MRQSIAQDEIKQRTVDLQPAIGVNEAQFPEPVREEADPRAGCADHFRQHFLTNLGNYTLGFPFFAKMGEQQKHTGQPFFARIEKAVQPNPLRNGCSSPTNRPRTCRTARVPDEALLSWLFCQFAEQRNPSWRSQSACEETGQRCRLRRKSLRHLICRSLLPCQASRPQLVLPCPSG